MKIFKLETDMDKQKEISKEIDKLNDIFKDIPSQRLKLVENLIQNAAFMAVTLRELQQDVIKNGSVIPCRSGNGFETIKDNPAHKSYTTMIARYTDIIKRLSDLLPDGAMVNDGFDEFCEK